MIKAEPGNIVFDRPDIGHSQGDKMIKSGNMYVKLLDRPPVKPQLQVQIKYIYD